jgi:hypothetical protein
MATALFAETLDNFKHPKLPIPKSPSFVHCTFIDILYSVRHIS